MPTNKVWIFVSPMKPLKKDKIQKTHWVIQADFTKKYSINSDKKKAIKDFVTQLELKNYLLVNL